MYWSLSIMAGINFLSQGVMMKYLFCLSYSNNFSWCRFKFPVIIDLFVYTRSRFPWRIFLFVFLLLGVSIREGGCNKT